MKRILLAISAVCFLSAAARTPKFTCKAATAQKNIFKLNSEIPIAMTCEYPETYVVSGWNAGAYLRGLPAGFCEKLKLKPKINKDPKWTSVKFRSWTWLPAGKRNARTIEGKLSTKDWPAGDYAIIISLIFQKKDRKSKLPDVYKTSIVSFTIEK